MICCIGLFAGLLLGQYFGAGPILAPLEFIAGLTGDMTIVGLLGKRGGKKIERITQSCCLPPRQKIEPGGKGDVLLRTSRREKKKKKTKSKLES